MAKSDQQQQQTAVAEAEAPPAEPQAEPALAVPAAPAPEPVAEADPSPAAPARERIEEWAQTHITRGEFDMLRAWVHLEQEKGHHFDTGDNFAASFAAFCSAPA